jgi:hypothetical protein
MKEERDVTKQTKSKRMGLAGILTLAVAGLPQFAAAADRYERQESHYNSGGQSNYRGADQPYGYDNPRGTYREYRDQEYRGSGNWNGRNDSNRYRDNGYRGDDYGYYRRERSAGQSAAIIGGTAAARAAVGAMAGGGKGAAIGAAIGGIGGLIFDRTTTNHYRNQR